MAETYGHKLNPRRQIRNARGIKGIRQSVVITNNPTTIDQGQLLTVNFPNLGSDDVIVPGSVKLAFKISLSSENDDNRSIVHNIGRAIVQKVSVKIEGNEVYSLDNADVWGLYKDSWLTRKQRLNMAYQGIEDENVSKLRIEAGNKSEGANDGKDKAIADAFGNRYCIPLEFELLTDHLPFYQSGLKDRLSYELTFNSYSRVIKSTDTDCKYSINGISLEFEKVTNSALAQSIRAQYKGKIVVLYDRVLCHSKKTFNKEDTTWNINLNTPAKSLKGILLLFEDPSETGGGAPFKRDTTKFFNPKINKTTVTIEGVPNQLYAQGMYRYQHWQEIKKFFADAKSEHGLGIVKELDLSDVSIEKYLTSNYGLWLDTRSTDDNKIHGSGRRIENGSEGITLQLERTAEAAAVINCYIFVVMDAQLNIAEGRFQSALY